MAILEPETCVTETESSNGPEQRRHTRYVGVEAGVLRLAIRPEFRGRRGIIVDVSTSGMGFLLAQPVEPGTSMVFELPIPGSTMTITRIARVRHNRQHPVPLDAPWLPRTPALSGFFRRMFGQPKPAVLGEAWLVGCEFDRPLTEAEIQQLLNPVDESSGPK